MYPQSIFSMSTSRTIIFLVLDDLELVFSLVKRKKKKKIILIEKNPLIIFNHENSKKCYKMPYLGIFSVVHGPISKILFSKDRSSFVDSEYI